VRNLDDQTGADVVWVGTWHSLGHQVELVHVHSFSATFNAGAGPAGVTHSIASANAIAKLANQQADNGYAEWSENCNYYSNYWGRPCEEWCADFLQFVWKIAGVAYIGDITPAAASLLAYGEKHGTWHQSSSLSGIQPGDAVSYGVLDPADNNHVAIYVGNGQVVSGNSTGNDVRRHSAFYRTPSGYTEPAI
jgi:cell wall-associated NlpC family hydrolase